MLTGRVLRESRACERGLLTECMATYDKLQGLVEVEVSEQISSGPLSYYGKHSGPEGKALQGRGKSTAAISHSDWPMGAPGW